MPSRTNVRDRTPGKVSAREARSVLLGLQRLADPPQRSSPQAVGRLVNGLGYVQIDSINVLDRAHHLILSTRLTGFRPQHLTANLERSRRLFEHWTHDACAIPTRWYAHWKHRFGRYHLTPSRSAWWKERLDGKPEAVLAKVLQRVRTEGPMRARDFESTRKPKSPGWWEWKPEKAALELLWRGGELAIAGRDGFEKIYDLAERVHPEGHALPAPPPEDHQAWACEEALARLGMATVRELAAFFQAIPLAHARQWCARQLAAGRLERVLVEQADGGKPVECVALPEWKKLAAAGERGSDTPMLALCPFDPVIRERVRLQRLFGFDYRFEAFTPAPKRRYGYYVLPLLEGDRFVGRVDPRFDRAAGCLEIRGPWWESKVSSDRRRRARLADCLDRLAQNVGAARWTLVEP